MKAVIRRGERGIPRAANANLVKSWIQFRYVAKLRGPDDCPIDQHRLASQRKAAA